jgi:hypothetical protein
MHFRYEKLTICVDMNKLDLTKNILSQEEDNSAIHTMFASYLIHKAEALCEQAQYSSAKKGLMTQRTGLGSTLIHRSLIKKYEDYVFYLENTSPTSKKMGASSSSSSGYSNNESQINHAVELLDTLIYEFKKLKFPFTKFINEKVKLYYQAANIMIYQHNYSAAKLAVQKGRELMPTTGPNQFAKIESFLEKMRLQ